MSELKAKEAIEHIKQLDSLEALDAFVEGEERSTVIEAYEARKAELEQPEPEPEPELEQPDPEPDAGAERNEEPVALDKEIVKIMAGVLHEKSQAEAAHRSPHAKPNKLNAEFDRLTARFHRLAENGKKAKLSASELDSLIRTIQQKVSLDEQRRGMQQPCKADRDLAAVCKALTELAGH